MAKTTDPTFCEKCSDKFEALEAELCPEDFGFEEFIKSLERQNEALRAENREMRAKLGAITEFLTGHLLPPPPKPRHLL